MTRLGEAPVRPLLREQAPEPARFWIRYAPRQWPGPPGPWLDLAAGTLAEELAGGDTAILERLAERPLDDVLYLPPVSPALAATRDRLAARHAGRGTPVLVQLLPGDPPPAVDSPVAVVWDLTSMALSEEPEALAGLAAATAAAWPLLPGASTAVAEAAARTLAKGGVEALQAVPLDLDPRQRRALGEGLPEARYLALFHGAPPDAGPLARAAAAAGLTPLLRRPLPRPPIRGAGNLRLAGVLAGAGEVLLRLGGAEPRAQALLRAGRFAERSSHDLEALARDGNLGVLPWLDAEGRRLVEEAVADPAAERRLLLAPFAAGTATPA